MNDYIPAMAEGYAECRIHHRSCCPQDNQTQAAPQDLCHRLNRHLNSRLVALLPPQGSFLMA